MQNQPKAGPQRKRGRPAGKHRVPLTMEERRARNAQYERERRIEYNDAMAELAEAAGCPEGITNVELLSRVLSMIERSRGSESVSSYAQRNERLEQQILSIEQHLREEPEITVKNESDSTETCMRTEVVQISTKKMKVEAQNPQQMDCVETESPMQSHVHRVGALKATQSESLPAAMYQPSPSASPGSEDLGLLDGLDFNPALWTGVGSFGAETPATDIEVDGTQGLNWQIDNFMLEYL